VAWREAIMGPSAARSMRSDVFSRRWEADQHHSVAIRQQRFGCGRPTGIKRI
jgi:hypothetical protein